MGDRELVNQVRAYIYGAKEHKGKNYISERNIAEKFSLSRGVARDILLGLEGEGVLRRIPKKGYKYIDYNGTDPRSVDAVRLVIEREAVRKGISCHNREDIIRLTLILDDMDAAANKRDLEGIRKTDLEFHEALVKASKDNLLIKMFSFLQVAVFCRHHESYNDSFAETLKCHYEIFENFKAKKLKDTLKAVNKHLARWPE